MDIPAALDRSDDRRALAGLAGIGAALLLLCPVMLQCLIVGDDCEEFGWAAFVQGGVYAFGVWLVLRRSWGRGALYVIIAVAILARAIALPSPLPELSTDIYRYVWDGRVQGAGINPYRYIPSDEQLAPLRDAEIYPNINRSNYAPTIYPPVAQMIFFAVTRVSESLTAMKIAMIGFDIVTILTIVAILRREGRPAERVLIYAWHPLPIWEFAAAGHVDAAAIALMCLAMLLALSNRRLVAGAALALSALVKPFALVISPALWRPWDWRTPVAFLATAAICYLPYIGVGTKVLGFAAGYGGEEGYKDGWGFFPVALLRALGLPSPDGTGYTLAALAILAALAAIVAFRPRPPGEIGTRAPIVLATAFTLLVSPHYAWYFAWVLPFLCRCLYVPLLYVTVASFSYYLSGIIGADAYYRAGFILYGGFAILVVVDLMTRLRQSPVRRIA